MNPFRRTLFPALAVLLSCPPVFADGVILRDGRKLAGRVSEKQDGYEISVDGQTLSFAKDDVLRWIKSPKEVIGDADRLFEEAKKIYQDAVVLTDLKAAEDRFREALPKVQKARDAYAEARELFPEGYPEIDTQLVNIMKLMRLVRERIGSQMTGSTAPVKAKSAPPPTRTAKAAPPPPKPVDVPKPAEPPSPPAEPATPVEETVAPTQVAASATFSDSLAVLLDPARRAEDAQRLKARTAFKAALDRSTPLSDVAMMGFLFLSKSDEEWGLLTDSVTVKLSSGEQSWKGRLDNRSDQVSVLRLADGREARIRKAADGTYVAPPGGSEVKALDCKIQENARSEAFEALQSVFQNLNPDKVESLDAGDLDSAVQILALKTKDLRSKSQPVDALAVVVSGLASALLAKKAGKPDPAIESAFKDLGFEKSEFGAVWGRKEGLALDDYRKWLASGDYGLAVVQFVNDYRNVNEVNVRYALGLLMLFQALADNRSYSRPASYFDKASRELAGTAKDHFAALARSIREEAPCYVCAGTHKVNCSNCKGKGRWNFYCGTCGGSGKINNLRGGVSACQTCKGKGRYDNEPCPKCKATGKTDCKIRSCTREVPKPTFESFADAFTCPLCQGRGSMMKHVALPCVECSGIGLVLQPRSDPSKLLK
jgi:hypothetical protein